MSEDPRPDSGGPPGGGNQSGHSIWWVMLAAVLAGAIGLFAVSIHKHTPAEHGTTPISKTAPSIVRPPQ